MDGTELGSVEVMSNASWDLTACGPDGSGPFRLVLRNAEGSITEYFHDVDKAFCAIEAAERCPAGRTETVAADRSMLVLPRGVGLMKQFLSEEAWASGARH